MFRRDPGNPIGSLSPDYSSQAILLAVGLLGFISITSQLVLLREFLQVFTGNELVLGIILGNWLLLTGAGAGLGRFPLRQDNRQEYFLIVQALAAILPLLLMIILRGLRSGIFLRGEAIGIYSIILLSFFLLLPLCLCTGWLLSVACGLLKDADPSSTIRAVYVADGLGSVMGGFVFGYLWLRWFDHAQILCGVAAMGLASAGFIAWLRGHWRLAGAMVAIIMGLVTLMQLLDLDTLLTQAQYPGQTVLYRGNSPYGRWVVTRLANQITFNENSMPYMSNSDVGRIEETVHYAMSQRPRASRVLLLAGGLSGTARELLKYNVREVVYVELDPLLLRLGRRFEPEALADPRIHVVNTDGRRYVQQAARGTFDVVIMDMPDPQTAQLNRFFTREFFSEVKRALAADGVFSLSLGQYANFIGPEQSRLLSSLNATLKEVFPRSLIIPGGRFYFLVSTGPLYEDLASRLETAGVSTRFVNWHYLAATLQADRIAEVQRVAGQPARVNRDFHPVLYFYHQLFWLSQFGSRTSVFAIGLAGLVVVWWSRAGPAPIALFAAGFAASSLEIVLLLGFQIICGSLYFQLGLVVTIFMGGLALGAWLTQYSVALGRCPIAWVSAGIALVAVLIPGSLMGLSRLNAMVTSDAIAQMGIGAITALLAVMVGMQFPLAARGESATATGIAARLYWADLLGASLGAFAASAWMIPCLGVTGTCAVVAALNGVAGALAGRRQKG
jgi:spermidine synthase